MRKFLFDFIGLLLLMYLLLPHAHGQEVVQWGKVDQECYFLPLDQGWQGSDGQSYAIPILPPKEANSFTLKKTFFLPDSFPDELMLWVGRYAWEMEVLLNGKYLTVAQKPFNEWKLAIEKNWLQKGNNQLEIRLSKIGTIPYNPLPVLGLWEGIGLIEASRMEDFAPPQLRTAKRENDTIALIAPYYGRHAYNFDELAAAKILLPLLKTNLDKVYFWFEPDRGFLAMCQKMGLQRTYSISDSQMLCAINQYPYNPLTHGKAYRYWLDGQGNRTPYYGEFERWTSYRRQELKKSELNWFVLLGILPFLCMAAIKILSPSYFASLANDWLGRSGRNENTTDSLFTSNLLNLILNLIKVLCQASFLSLGIYYLQHMNLWSLTRAVFSDESLFSLVFDGRDALPTLFFKILGILIIWQAFRLVSWFLAGRIFGKKQMVSRGFALEFMSDMPFVLFMALPWIIGLYTIDHGGEFMVGAMLVFFGIYGLRKLFLLFRDLGRIFNFSSGIKILYICTFNVLPYLIWL